MRSHKHHNRNFLVAGETGRLREAELKKEIDNRMAAYAKVQRKMRALSWISGICFSVCILWAVGFFKVAAFGGFGIFPVIGMGLASFVAPCYFLSVILFDLGDCQVRRQDIVEKAYELVEQVNANRRPGAYVSLVKRFSQAKELLKDLSGEKEGKKYAVLIDVDMLNAGHRFVAHRQQEVLRRTMLRLIARHDPDFFRRNPATNLLSHVPLICQLSREAYRDQYMALGKERDFCNIIGWATSLVRER